MKENKEAGDNTARLRAKVHFERGRHFFNANRFPEALAALEEAIAEDPEYVRAYTAKANTLALLGRPEEAITICDDIIAKNRTFALAYTTKASALHRAGRPTEAADNYRRGIELAPDEHLTHYNFACFWALEGNEEECEKHLRRALEIEPKSKPKAATDGDFAYVRGKEWFQNLIAFGN
jgi:tetratricopeptide (TPR) repeat protein